MASTSIPAVPAQRTAPLSPFSRPPPIPHPLHAPPLRRHPNHHPPLPHPSTHLTHILTDRDPPRFRQRPLNQPLPHLRHIPAVPQRPHPRRKDLVRVPLRHAIRNRVERFRHNLAPHHKHILGQ